MVDLIRAEVGSSDLLIDETMTVVTWNNPVYPVHNWWRY